MTIFSNLTLAQPKHAGIIVKLSGDVEVYTNESKKASGPKPRVMYQNKYYSIKKARLGFKIGQNQIVKTGNDSKARIVYRNGDQFNIGEGSEYKVTIQKVSKGKKKEEKSVINLMRGQFRAIISKKGPRNNLEVKTRHASMGVRGTDFFVAKRGNTGSAKVSVLRGEVEVKVKPKSSHKSSSKKKKKAQVINLKPGFSAKWKPPAEVKKSVTKKTYIEIPETLLAIQKTTKRDLIKIQKASVIKVKPEEEKIVPDKIAEEVKRLEKAAIKTTMADIKEHDPKLYAKLKKEPAKNVAMLNTQVIKDVYEEAPKASLKPDLDDLEELEENAYEKYFTIE